MSEPQIRIFPHGLDEFPSVDSLTTWLLTGLRARGGRYYLKAANAVADLQPGSIVLFRHGHLIVGEALVVGSERQRTKGRTIGGEDQDYEAYIDFSPTSIRLFAPPVAADLLQSFVGETPRIVQHAGLYYIIGWQAYPQLLAHLAKNAIFV